jgi:putative aldouronate transport system permease protein
MIGIGYRNTIALVVVGTTLSMLMTCFGAYALSCKWLMGRKILMFLVTIPMFFGGGLIPGYLLVRQLGLYNTFWALILPGAMNAYNLFILRNYFQSIPESLEESAHLDGANSFTVLFRSMNRL